MITDPAKAIQAQFAIQSKLKDAGLLVCFAGDMQVPQRWDVLRRAITEFGFVDQVMTRLRNGFTETYGRAFERATGQKLSNSTEKAA